LSTISAHVFLDLSLSLASTTSKVTHFHPIVAILSCNEAAIADDTEIWKTVTVLEDAEGLQQDLERLETGQIYMAAPFQCTELQCDARLA